MNLKHLRKRVAKLAGPPAQCPSCAARPTVATRPEDTLPCPACGSEFQGVEVVSFVVKDREQLAAARAALPSGATLLDDKGPTPAGLIG